MLLTTSKFNTSTQKAAVDILLFLTNSKRWNDEAIPFGMGISLCGVYSMPCTGLPGMMVHQMAAANAERHHEYRRTAHCIVHAGCVYGWRVVS